MTKTDYSEKINKFLDKKYDKETTKKPLYDNLQNFTITVPT